MLNGKGENVRKDITELLENKYKEDVLSEIGIKTILFQDKPKNKTEKVNPNGRREKKI